MFAVILMVMLEKTSSGFEGLHGGHGYGVRNPIGARILKVCVAADLVINNTFFTKCDSQLLTLRSGNACSQIDYVLVQKRDFKSVCDFKVIRGKECVSHHKLLVGDIGDIELNTSFIKHHTSYVSHVVHQQNEMYENCLI